MSAPRISGNVVPAHILARMASKDRPAGVAGFLPTECAEVAIAKSEKHLQQQLYSLLYRRGHRPRMQRMDRKSNIAIGMPDISFEVYGQSVHWEVKMPGKNPEPAQISTMEALTAPPNGAITRVIRSYREGLTHIEELTVRFRKGDS